MKKKYLLFLLLLASFIILNSCAPGNDKFEAGPAGFWMGIWHGFISLFTFIISIFNDNITIYEVNNTGKWYNLGFIIGIMMFYGGGGKTSCRRR